MSVPKHASDWNELAGLDPMWAVLSDTGKRFGAWDADDFFATGRKEIDDLETTLHRLGLSREFDSALDFGSGLGRITRALSERCSDVVGVDISRGMIERAQALNPACHFVFNPFPDLRLFPPDRFQLVYCRRVLQHQPTESQILAYVSEFVRVLKPGGIAAFQIPSQIPLRNRVQPRRRIYAVLRLFGLAPRTLYQLGLHPISMIAVGAEAVVDVVRSVEGAVLAMELDTVSCPGILSNFFYVSK